MRIGTQLQRIRLWALLVLVGLLGACGDPAGTDCEIAGSGFHAKDPCRFKCLSRWQVICPGDRSITPSTCSGAFDCEPGSCPDGQVCYHDDDPFDDRSFCVMATTCGDLSPQELSAWELSTQARQQEVRREREEKEARRAAWQAEHGRNTSGPAAKPPEATAQPASAPTPDSDEGRRRSSPVDHLPYDERERELMGSCGLPLDQYELTARVLPRSLGLDIDGDDTGDHVVQIRRIVDDARGLALCRAGTWAEWIGAGHPAISDSDLALTLSAMEAWRVVDGDHGPFGYEEEPPWPEMDGQALVVERLEKSMALLFWRNGRLQTRLIYRFVEP